MLHSISMKFAFNYNFDLSLHVLDRTAREAHAPVVKISMNREV